MKLRTGPRLCRLSSDRDQPIACVGGSVSRAFGGRLSQIKLDVSRHESNCQVSSSDPTAAERRLCAADARRHQLTFGDQTGALTHIESSSIRIRRDPLAAVNAPSSVESVARSRSPRVGRQDRPTSIRRPVLHRPGYAVTERHASRSINCCSPMSTSQCRQKATPAERADRTRKAIYGASSNKPVYASACP